VGRGRGDRRGLEEKGWGEGWGKERSGDKDMEKRRKKEGRKKDTERGRLGGMWLVTWQRKQMGTILAGE
jgi:hypothetical protein